MDAAPGGAARCGRKGDSEMTLTQLQYFCKACELHNITKAAEQLFVSQPTVTASIRSLEKEFGVTLLERQYKGFQLTEEGHIFYEEARQFLMEAEHFEQRIRWMVEKKSSLVLGLTRSSGVMIYAEYFPFYAQKHTNVQVHVITGAALELVEELAARHIDAAILPMPPQGLPDTIRVYPLRSVEFALTVSENHPLAGRKIVTVEDILHEKLVSTVNDSLKTRKLEEMFAAYGAAPNVVYRYDQLSTAFHMIRSENLCGVFPKEMAERQKNIVAVPLAGMEDIDASLIVLAEALAQKKAVGEFARDIAKFYHKKN